MRITKSVWPMIILGIMIALKNRQYSMWELYRSHLNANLETQVQERTAALSQANRRLEDDITGRQRAETALRESEVRYRELFENINSGVAVYTVIGNGQDFIFKDFNRAGEAIDHDQRERLIGKSIFEVRPGVEQFGLIDVFRQVWQTGKPAHHPVTLYQDNRLSAWYENFVYKLPSGEIVAVFADITERKQADRHGRAVLSTRRQEPIGAGLDAAERAGSVSQVELPV